MNHYQLIDGQKSVPLNALPKEAWTIVTGDLGNDNEQVQKLYAAVAFLYRCVDVRASALMSVPWSIYRLEGNADEPVWNHDDDENPPKELAFLHSLPELLWLTEASMSLTSEAFWIKDFARGKTPKDVRYMQPKSVTSIWDKEAGLTGFKRSLGQSSIRLSLEEVVYVWRRHPLYETKPNTSPAEAAMMDARVIYHASKFAQAFFQRGAVKATLLTVPRETPPEQREKLKTWWDRLFAGSRNAHSANVISADVNPIIIGEGLAELSDKNLSQEKRENIATAMGVPHSLVLSNAANYATAHEDKLSFYEHTIVPDLRLISRAVNGQLLNTLGYKLQFNHQELAVFQENERERSQSFAQYVAAGMKRSIAAQILGIDLPENMEYEELDEVPESDTPTSGIGIVRPVTAPPDASIDRDAEIRRFRAWAKKRASKKDFDPSQFASDVLTDDDRAEVLAELEDAGAPMRPFPSIWVGKTIPDAEPSALAFKQMLLRLDPDDEEGERKLRDRLERRNLADILDGFGQTLDRMGGDFVVFDDPNEAARNIQNAYRRHNGATHDAIRRTVTRSADFGVGMAAAQLERVGLSVDWDLPLIEARDWANRYTFDLIRGIDATTEARMQRYIATWFETSEGLDALIDDLTPIFGRQRAEMIAATETTRAAAEGQLISYRESGVVEYVQWHTAADERVCPICGPNEGFDAPVDSPTVNGEQIPAHVNCRCWWVPVIR